MTYFLTVEFVRDGKSCNRYTVIEANNQTEAEAIAKQLTIGLKKVRIVVQKVN